VLADAVRIAKIGPPSSQADVFYYHNDHLGTPNRITDEGATVVWAADYGPFGKTMLSVKTVTSNFRFPGQYFDSETGLHYNYLRDYDPELGRYIESDPIGLDGSMSLYSYTDSNPIGWIDLDGARRTQIGGRGNSGNPRPLGRNLSNHRGTWTYGNFYPRIGNSLHSEPTPSSPLRPRSDRALERERQRQNERQKWELQFGPDSLLPNPNDWYEFFRDSKRQIWNPTCRLECNLDEVKFSFCPIVTESPAFQALPCRLVCRQ
jgi:RHS repeat-associated protein